MFLKIKYHLEGLNAKVNISSQTCSETIWMKICGLFTILSYVLTLCKTQLQIDCALPPYWLKTVIFTGRSWRIQPVPDTAEAVVQWRDTGKQHGIHSLPHFILPLYFQYAWYPFHEFYLYCSWILGSIHFSFKMFVFIKKKDLNSFFQTWRQLWHLLLPNIETINA